MSERELRFGQVGFGPWGWNIVKALASVEGVRLARAASRSWDHRGERPEGCILHDDWRELIASGDLDGLLVAVAPAIAPDIAIAAIQAGVPVFLEKPIALTPLRAADLLKACREARGAIAQVDHIDLFNPAFERLRELLPSLGRLAMVDVALGKPAPGRPDCEALWEYGPHPVAIALTLAGRLPARITAVLEPADSAGAGRQVVRAELEFEGGPRSVLRFGNGMRAPCRKVVVAGEKGTLVFDDLAGVRLERLDVAGQERGPLGPLDGRAPLVRALNRFSAAVRAGRPDWGDVELAANVVGVLSAIEKMLLSGISG